MLTRKRTARSIEFPGHEAILNRGVHVLARYQPNPYRQQAETPALKPVSLDTGNELRPTTLNELVGQATLKPLLRRLIDNARAGERPLGHVLLIGAGGTGKTTLAMVIARELGARCFVLKPPIDMGTLRQLTEAGQHGDVVFLDEIHNQVHGDRRGITEAVDPENLYHVLEDRLLMLPDGPVPFPHLTWIGGTTDAGLLPVSLIDRFPIQPELAPYTMDEMGELACRNLRALSLTADETVPELFAASCRLNPRQLNNYVRTALDMSAGTHIDDRTARDVLQFAGVTLDGLTPSMQKVLVYLYLHCGRVTRGEQVYSASVSNLATAAGHSRDTKYIQLMVEPWLLQAGLVQVRPGYGRVLTPRGLARAIELSGGTE